PHAGAFHRAVRGPGGAGFLRARLLRRYRAGELPLALAGPGGAVAIAAAAAGPLAAVAAPQRLGACRRGPGLGARLLRAGVGARTARAHRIAQVVPIQLRRLGRAGRWRART